MAALYPTAGLTVVFLLLSAFFSASETALFSIPRERIPFFKQSSSKSYQWIFSLLHDGQRTLLLILLGNLIVNITAVGLIHSIINAFVKKNVILVTMLVATGVILLFGEIIPKNIAIRNSERIAVYIAPFLYHLKIVLHPVLFVLQKINTFFLTGFSRHLRKPSPYITLEEFKSSLAESTRDGVVSENEWHILKSVLEAADTPVSHCMIHRSQLPYVSSADSLSQAVTVMCEKEQTVCCVRDEQNLEEIIGLVYLSDALKNNKGNRVRDCMKQVLWVPESSELADLVGDMLQEGYGEVCVHNEFGTFVGIFSLKRGLQDILEVSSLESRDMAEGVSSRQFNGLTELATMKEWIPPSLMEQAKSVRTLNGLISLHLGKIPKAGERFAINEWNFYIIKSKLNSVESVLITKRG